MTELQIGLSALCGLVVVQLAALMIRDVRPGRVTYALPLIIASAVFAGGGVEVRKFC